MPLSWIVFDNSFSNIKGLFLNTNLYIKDSTDPKYIRIIDVTGIGKTILSISDLLNNPFQWIDILPKYLGEKWGIDILYKVGDVVIDNGASYIALEDHVSKSGNKLNSSPTQLNSNKWNMLIGSETSEEAMNLNEINEKIKISKLTELKFTKTNEEMKIIKEQQKLQEYQKLKIKQHQDQAAKIKSVPVPASDPDVAAGAPIWYDQTIGVEKWVKGDEQGGILHKIGEKYLIGDLVTLDGSSFIYVCKTAHVSTVACNIAPDDAWWYQPTVGAIPTLTYNFTSDIGGTISPAAPDPLIPGHAHEHDGLTGIPDENGPYYFSVALGSVGKPAEVQLEGFELAPVDYDTTIDGYVKILSPVADNSWLKIII